MKETEADTIWLSDKTIVGRRGEIKKGRNKIGVYFPEGEKLLEF